ncbi:hypothetical protein B0T16DRAFT_329666 [Cercophora newfieldiana]|uniref:TMEM205-like domain-containing protein n=1 Tax=Cercophora newfieldiana TaxID=92897 RepID=A0AA40CQ67_9PEZI|nr:hypothetical protein B0T16DRAFT_329666 [Cercophora newfieldiana]
MAGSSLFSLAPYHILSYGTLLGTTFFHTFVGGIVSFQVLARPQFSILMAKLFPVYFTMQTALPVVLALTYPGGSSAPSGIAGVLENSTVLYSIAATFATGLANLAVVGPATTKCMDQRKLQERKDGKKSYDAPPHSQEMTALNKQFAILHGVSSLLNLGTFIGTVVYGFNLASRL